MSEELRPCPFCGEMPVTENNLVACANKSCPTYDNYWTDPQILTIEQWNTRPIEDALNARIAELEAENEKIDYFFRRLRMFCIFAHWDNPNTEADFKKVDAEIRDYFHEYKVCIDQLTAHDATERQDDKSPNDTQSQTIVYGKEDSEDK